MTHALLAVAAAPPPEGFEPVTGPVSESISPIPLVVGAYGFIWVALLFYLALLWRRQAALRAELDQLRAHLGKDG